MAGSGGSDAGGSGPGVRAVKVDDLDAFARRARCEVVFIRNIDRDPVPNHAPSHGIGRENLQRTPRRRGEDVRSLEPLHT